MGGLLLRHWRNPKLLEKLLTEPPDVARIPLDNCSLVL